MQRFVFAPKAFTLAETAVVAPDLASARRKAMVLRWGSAPDAVVPHAPNYLGKGLVLIKAEPVE